jgi:NADPH:quinone reductase-like Zn-dependent oxidoreductase
MKAVGVTEFGGPDALQVLDLPTPEPGPGEVRIRVHAAAVNPTDLLFRAGAQAARLDGRTPPYLPGMDLAGVVARLGPGADSRLAVGDPVVGIALPAGPHGGAYAQEVVLPAASVVRAPEGVALPAASTFVMNALTAQLALDALAIPPGGAVAVTGAAGAFGGYVVQLAATAGLTVVADAGERDRELVRSLGAGYVVERGEGFAAAVRRVVPDGVDGLADGALLHEKALPAIRDGGGLAVVRGWNGPTERGIALHKIMVGTAAADTAAIARLVRQVDEGVLTLRVADVLPAEQAPEAHRRLEAGGVRGRVVLDFT